MSWWILLYSRKSFKRKSVKVSWKCERATTTKKNVKCLGRVSTIGECEPVNDITEHNNIPDPIREEFLSVVNENKRLALETNDNPRTIIKNSQTSLSNEASANIVRHYNLRQTIHRIRNKKAGHGVNSKTREEIKIDEELKKIVTQRERCLYYQLSAGLFMRVI
jgi:hypothetical protein